MLWRSCDCSWNATQILCTTGERIRHVEVAIMMRCGQLDLLWTVAIADDAGGHPLVLCRELLLLLLLVAVAYSSSGSHCSGWNSGFRKCAVLKCELEWVSVRLWRRLSV